MRKRLGWLILTLACLAAPSAATAQDIQGYFVPPVDFVGPLSHPRYEEGGLFVGLEFIYLRQNRPLYDQRVANRGFFDLDGTLTGRPGSFVGSGDEALNVEQLRGPGTFQPGSRLFFGWRFLHGVSVSLDWWHLADARYSASASLFPGNFNLGPQLQDTFITAPVFNFPVDFAGTRNLPDNLGTFGTTFGVWNAASQMQIDFIQRFDLFQVNARIPVWETQDYRSYGLFGPRIVALWERFRWRTVDMDAIGQSNDATTAIYSNVTSNRLYGFHAGGGQDWYLGSTPIGAFSCELDLEGGLYIDFAKGRARYELGDQSVGSRRSRNMTSLVPAVEGRLGLKWYPWEAIQLGVGYNGMAYFNTWGSRRPIDFNYGTTNPKWESVHRWIHGLDLGITFVF